MVGDPRSAIRTVMSKPGSLRRAEPIATNVFQVAPSALRRICLSALPANGDRFNTRRR